MNYQKIYNQIVERAKIRIKEIGVYYENHHITPRCLGGTDYKNLVCLTAKEHFLVHFLLIRIHPDNIKVAHAFFCMCRQHNKSQKRYLPSSRTYQEARQQFLDTQKIFWSNEENRLVRSLQVRKVWNSEKRKKEHIERNRNRFRSEEEKQKTSNTLKNQPRKTCERCFVSFTVANFQRHYNSCIKQLIKI